METPRVKGREKASVPTGLWRACEECDHPSLAEDVEKLLETCPNCGAHFRIGARARLASFLDVDSAIEISGDLEAADPLNFKDSKRYLDRVKAARKTAEENEAFILVEGRLRGRRIVGGAFEFRFLGGSMGSVVGEKVTRAFELGVEYRAPVVIFSASGGARMQEGILSLMQMAKTSA